MFLKVKWNQLLFFFFKLVFDFFKNRLEMNISFLHMHSFNLWTYTTRNLWSYVYLLIANSVTFSPITSTELQCFFLVAIQPSQNGLFHADRRPKSPKIKHFLHLQQLIKGNKMNIFIDKLKQLLAIAKLKKNIDFLY